MELILLAMQFKLVNQKNQIYKCKCIKVDICINKNNKIKTRDKNKCNTNKKSIKNLK